MRGLAWDDEIETNSYFGMLRDHFKRNITLELVSDQGEFIEKFLSEKWDFVVTDVVDERALKGTDDRSGLTIARQVSQAQPDIPVFMITKEYHKIDPGELGLARNVIVKSKSLHAGWMADEIATTLKEKGRFIDRRRVFLIYGQDRHADGAKGRVKQFLQDRGVNVCAISGTNLTESIDAGLVKEMNECAAFVAICTPDDIQRDGSCHPRLNVLLEIGLAMGLSRGIARLTILQKDGPSKDEVAHLPTDLGGVLTLKFEGLIQNQFDKLAERLRMLGVELADTKVTRP